MASGQPFLLLLLFLFALFSLFDPRSRAAKLPFHPEDVLPLLPRQLSWPILNALRRPLDLLPAFVGAASPSNGSLAWKGACFCDNTAWLEFHNETWSEFGGGTLHIKVSKAHSWTCMDIYVFATPYHMTWDYYFLSREHTFEFKDGVSIFLMQAGMLGTLQALWDVFPLFSSTGWGEKSNIGFLKKHMGALVEQRPQPWVTNINIDDICDSHPRKIGRDNIHSGDFLAISKIRGRWGGFETLEKWVSGAYAGHTAVCLRDSEGKLWVGESGHDNEQGEDVIAVLPWDEWWEFELNKDDSNPHIALLPLHPDMRAKFNETAAWEHAESMNGKPYESIVLLYVASVMTVWNQMQPAYAANMWNEALNKRLGTEGLDLPDLLVETEMRGSSFAELLTIPEQDDWVYSDGKSASCVAFVLEISIQVTEFTIKDAYSLKFFENNSSRLPKWSNDGDDVELPFCQIQGRYRMELPGYNTMDLYPHMNERCPSLPPKYSRPSDC
ncbi:hypothetical protein EUGRSUZ_F00893 [Eucalyptus grandis]|uniref:Uncharacterized protein n=2 Tax=Eucalyptus grandis TaxID=71139 RepID=A0ACC3KDP1_EUCGR|nr:hypothetical protein EUGRSUZ_F00893 [Eucalyptus grandis]